MAKKKELDLEEEVKEETPIEEEAPVEEEPVAKEEPVEEKKTKTPKTIKAQVVAAYSDKYDGTIHRPGETIEVTQKRFNEINSKKTHIKRA